MDLDGRGALALTLLGTMALTRGGEEIALPSSKKTRALLAHLATQERPVRRERLCTIFWELPDDPRGSLRWSLSKLRALVDDAGGHARLVADRETVRFDCSECRVDWRALREAASGDPGALDTAELATVVSTGGEFLEGLELPRCDQYQAWLVAMREDVRLWRIALLRELAGRAIDPDEAVAHAREWVELDPHDALARAGLVELLDKTGRTQEADSLRVPGTRPPETPAASPASEEGEPLPLQRTRFCHASDGTGLAYSVVGSGPPLVKTANWLNHLEHDWDSPLWRHWIRGLTEFRTLVRYDERGNGLSDWQTPEISFDAFVNDLESVVDAAGIEQFDLLGMSQGASVSIAYSVRHPQRVRRLILYGGYAAGWLKRAKPEEIERREAMLTLSRVGWGQNNPAFRQIFSTLFMPDANPAETEWFNELQRLSTSPENAARLQRAFSEIDVRDLLPQVSVPTLVLHPREDAVVPFVAGRELAATIPNAEFVPLESRNHMILEGEPAWPRALMCIREFLA